MRIQALIPTLLLAIGLGACSGSNPTDAVTPPPPPPPVATAVASFTSPVAIAANAPVAFDASASTASDGSALQYFWEFGDGRRGGGRLIAHVYPTGGDRSVTLTVKDGAGRTATQVRIVSVTAPPVATASATVQGIVRTTDGTALAGVSIAVVGATTSASSLTDASGRATLALDLAVPVVLKLTKGGYADQFVVLRMPATAGADAGFEATMRTRDAALTLADAAAGGTVTGRDGATLTLPANALVDGSGAAVTGSVEITATPVDPTQPAGGGFPGQFDGVRADGVATPIVSYGTVEFGLSAGSRALALAPGRTATITIPMYASLNLDRSAVNVGATIPLWSLDEATGVWIQEGQGTVIASSGSPSGLALQANVSHFSWWNADNGFAPYGPKPRCVYDTDIGLPPGSINTFATATICNMLAQFDRPPPTAPVTAAGEFRIAAATLAPAIVGYARRVVLPIGGNVVVPVPAGVNIALEASALNGTWTGRSIVNGPFAVEAEELVKLRPVAVTGPGIETVSLPFDATRGIAAGQTARFGFAGTRLQFARVTVAPGIGSTLTGTTRLLRDAAQLGTVNFGPATGVITARLPEDGAYVAEIGGLTNMPGSYRLQLDLIGGIANSTLAYPFDSTKTLAAFTTQRESFSVATPQTVLLAMSSQSTTHGVSARVTSAAGATLANLAPTGAATMTTATLTAAGDYALELGTDDGSSKTYRVTAERTQWVQDGTTLPIDNAFAISDFLTDRNGAPVVVYTNTFDNSGHTSARVLLRRWTGSGWESATADLTVDRPCGGSAPTVAVVFDAANAPLVVYPSGSAVAGDSATWLVAQRFTAGAWSPVGPNEGRLPNGSAFLGACASPPSLAIAGDGRTYIAYRANNKVFLQKFDGTAWVAATGTAGDSWDLISNNTYQLRAAPDGTLYFTLAVGAFNGGNTAVRKLVANPTPQWSIVGTNGANLPEIGSCGLAVPQMVFDSANRPIIGFSAAIGDCSSAGSGVATVRFNGTSWTTTGATQAGVGSRVSNSALRIAQSGGETYGAWTNVSPTTTNVPVVQKNTAAGWAAFGAGLGEVPQFVRHGVIEASGGIAPLLTDAGGVLYMVVTGQTGTVAGNPTQGIFLMRKVD